MTTHEPPERRNAGRMLVPGVALLGGLAYLVAGIVGDQLWFGLFGLGIMVVFALVVLLLGRRSETVDGLLSRRDERINTIDRDATLFAGVAVLVVDLAMFVVEIARGQDGSPYYQLAAVGGVAYLVGLVVLRFRR
ncbi:MAG: hypothetical protein ACRDPH_15470 [Marmoricola sp.]